MMPKQPEGGERFVQQVQANPGVICKTSALLLGWCESLVGHYSNMTTLAHVCVCVCMWEKEWERESCTFSVGGILGAVYVIRFLFLSENKNKHRVTKQSRIKTFFSPQHHAAQVRYRLYFFYFHISQTSTNPLSWIIQQWNPHRCLLCPK